MSALVAAGCSSNKPTSKDKAKIAWADARAAVLLNLANEQYQRGSLDEARKTVRDGLRTSNRLSGLHLLQAKLDIEDNQLPSAAMALAAARQLAPSDPEIYYVSGIVAERWQQPENALKEYTKASELAPGELAYLLAVAETQIALDRADEAAQVLEAKLVYFESSAPIRDMLAQIYQELGRHAEAAEMLRQAALLMPDDLGLRERYAMALVDAGDRDKAAEVLERLMEKPEYANQASLHVVLAECRMEQEQPEAARASFMRAARIDPKNVVAWLGVGRASLATGDLDRAEYALTQAQALKPTGRDGVDTLLIAGYLRLKQNRVQEAANLFQRATGLDREDATPVAMYGLCQQRLGRIDAARQYYERALALDPDDRLARQLMDALASAHRESSP